MVSVSISGLKAKLSEHIRRVKAGEEVIVTERGRAVAILSPIPRTSSEDADLQELVEKGLIRAGEGPVPDDFFDLPRPDDPEGSVLLALLEERREGR